MTASIALVTLVVREYDEAITFFTEALRFRLVEDKAMGDGKRWVVVAPADAKGTGLVLAKAVSAEQDRQVGNQAGGRVCMFLHTRDFWGDYRHMQSRGVRFTEQPREEAYGRVVVFLDICGNKWDLVQAHDA